MEGQKGGTKTVTTNGAKQGVSSLHPTHCDSAFYRRSYYDDNRGGSSGCSKDALDRLKLLRSSRNTVGFFECSAESVIRPVCCLIASTAQGVTLKRNLVNSEKVTCACVNLQTGRKKQTSYNSPWYLGANCTVKNLLQQMSSMFSGRLKK